MRGVFDEEAVEPAKATNETELTLSSTVLLGIALGLVALCGVCFGLGYMAGNRGTPETPASKRTDATAPTTLQADSSLSKPSAVTQAAAAPAPAAESATNAVPAGADPDAGPIANSPSPSPAPSAGPSSPSQAQERVRPALPTATYSGQPAQQQAVQPAMAPTNVTMVQIAALANPADAAVLMNALHRRGYATFARREPADGLIHVRIGPFSNRDLANQWRLKLLSDGYNAIVQP